MEWMHFDGEDTLPSPALVLHWDRIESNLQRMLRCVGNAGRLRPHLKTHKLADITRRQVELGITKCKTATIAEAQMAADAGATDILVAMQPVGPQVERLVRLITQYPATRFSALCDHPAALAAMATTATGAGVDIELLIDINVGQNRTGIIPGDSALALYAALNKTPGIRCGGLHGYDGHIHHADPLERKSAWQCAFEPFWIFRESLRSLGLAVPRIVAGGSPTFPFHSETPEVECSPGTTVLWDAGSNSRLGDMPYETAAVLMARVVSLPSPESICLDLGYKAVASETPQPRVVFPGFPDAAIVAHNEEHLVLQSSRASACKPGDRVFGIPWHVCPTVALHTEVAVVRNGILQGMIPVTARSRRLTI